MTRFARFGMVAVATIAATACSAPLFPTLERYEVEQVIARYDCDGDKKLSASEASVIEFVGRAVGDTANRKIDQPMHASLDLNKDGLLDLDELETSLSSRGTVGTYYTVSTKVCQ